MSKNKNANRLLKKKPRSKWSFPFKVKKFPILLTVLFLSMLIVLGSTYAWFTSEDNRVNNFLGTRFAAEIEEDFEPNYQWHPGLKTTKIVTVRNTGDVPAFVRLSLTEYLLLFEVDVTDQTGNGNLKRASSSQTPIVESNQLATWEAAANAGGTYEYEGIYYIANDYKTGSVALNDTTREGSAFKWFELEFPTNVYTTAPGSSTKNYWLYSDGYFYYSELLKPGEATLPVLNSVRLSQSAPNKYKGALYQLNPVMDAHDATETLVSAWSLPTSGVVHNMYKDYLK